ncbi:MAG: GNAT family N-acetyltransferase [Haliea sp.]
MNISFRPLTKYDANYRNVIGLYKEAFPGARFIPTWILRYKLRKGKAGFNVLYADNTWIGLIYTTAYKDIIFVQFLAILDSYRSAGLGSKVMDLLREMHSEKRIVLTIEEIDKHATNYQQRIKRREFYERNGFSSSGYIVKEPSERLEMMIIGGSISKGEIEELYESLLGGRLGFFFGPEVMKI